MVAEERDDDDIVHGEFSRKNLGGKEKHFYEASMKLNESSLLECFPNSEGLGRSLRNV